MKTRFKELRLEDFSTPGNPLWRFVDTDGNAAVGPHYASKIEALCDLERYSKVFGCE